MCSEPQAVVYYEAFNYIFCNITDHHTQQFLTYDSGGSITAAIFTAVIQCLAPIIWPFTAN